MHFPNPSDATHIVDKDWPTGPRDIKVEKSERTEGKL